MSIFYLLWMGRMLSVFGNKIAVLAISFYLYQTTQSPIYLSLAFVLSTLPGLITLQGMNKFINKDNVKFINIIIEALTLLITVALFICLYFNENKFMLLIYIAISSTGNTFAKTTHHILTQRTIKDNNLLMRANGLNEMMHNMAWAIAPIIASFLLSKFTFKTIFLIYILILFLTILSLFFTKIPFIKNNSPLPTASDLPPKQKQPIRSILLLSFIRNVLSSFIAVSLIPLVLSSYSMGILSFISLIGSMGILAAIIYPVRFDSSYNTDLICIIGQWYICLAIIIMAIPFLIPLSLGLFLFFYFIILSNSYDVIYYQKINNKEWVAAMLNLREVFCIAGRLFGYILSGFLLQYLFKPLTMKVLVVSNAFSKDITAHATQAMLATLGIILLCLTSIQLYINKKKADSPGTHLN